MAKTIPQYRQEKYEKYTSWEEGKLFYRHEKNLDLVNTVGEIVYILQEENPWNDYRTKQILNTQGYYMPDKVRKIIQLKIKQAYTKGVRAWWRNGSSIVVRIFRKVLYNNDPRKYLQEQYPLITDTIATELSENIVSISYGGIPVFFIDDEDRSTLVKHDILKDTSGAYRGIWERVVIFLRQKNSHEINERYFMHEYQHYLFHNFLAREFDNQSIDHKLADEICAICVDNSNAGFLDIVQRLEPYIARFANVDYVSIEEIFINNWVIQTSISVKNNWEFVRDKKILSQVRIVVDKAFEYTKLLSLFLDLFKNNERLNIDRQKAIRLLSMTSPHYRKDLLIYYTKLAKYMKSKK